MRANREVQRSPWLDILGLLLAGFINTFLALFVAGVLLAPGTVAGQAEMGRRILWIAENDLLWRGGWLFWFVVTLSFAWSYFAIGRHLQSDQPWPALAISLALVAAAVDIVGVVIQITIVPDLAHILAGGPGNLAVETLFQSMESVAVALINVTAFGLYSFAGLLLLPALFSTPSYPRWAAWLGTAEWGLAILATGLLVLAPHLATGPLLISFALFAPWVWSSAWWLWREKGKV